MSKAGRARYFASVEKAGRETRKLLSAFSTSPRRPGVVPSTTESAVHPASRIAAHDRSAPSPRPIVVSPSKVEAVTDYLRAWSVVKLEGLARQFTNDDEEAAEALCRAAHVQMFKRAGALWCVGWMRRSA